MKKISIVLLLFASIILLFSCNNDDCINKEVNFIPFQRNDTCFTATVSIERNDVKNGVLLDFDVKEEPKDKDLRYFIYSAPNEILTQRFVYNVEALPKGIKNGDKIKFKILSYHVGGIGNAATLDRIIIHFNIQPQ